MKNNKSFWRYELSYEPFLVKQIIQVCFFDHVFCHCPLIIIESIVMKLFQMSSTSQISELDISSNNSSEEILLRMMLRWKFKPFTKLETTRLETYAFNIPLLWKCYNGFSVMYVLHIEFFCMCHILKKMKKCTKPYLMKSFDKKWLFKNFE